MNNTLGNTITSSFAGTACCCMCMDCIELQEGIV